jgi:hypothetical protein
VADTNVDLILAGLDAVNVGDLDAMMELWAPVVVILRVRGSSR